MRRVGWLDSAPAEEVGLEKSISCWKSNLLHASCTDENETPCENCGRAGKAWG